MTARTIPTLPARIINAGADELPPDVTGGTRVDDFVRAGVGTQVERGDAAPDPVPGPAAPVAATTRR